jgi:asparagine synthase (glutamine-hydrolysing)
MSAIAGIVRHDNCRVDLALAERMIERLAHRGPDSKNAWARKAVGLGHAMLWTTPESLHEVQPLHSSDGVFTLVADARIDNRAQLMADLQMGSEPNTVSDSALILAAYRSWGENCPARLLGDFAFAIWNGTTNELFCARDPIGVRSLYYYRGSRLFAFASEIKALFVVPEIARNLNEERVADYFLLNFDDDASTFYRDIYRLPAGCRMLVQASVIKLNRYWAFDVHRELKLGSDAEYEEAFREIFTEAVRCRLRSAFPIGSTLSGGLDSSSITCIARQCLGKAAPEVLHSFSAVFPGLSGADLRRIDERSYVAAVMAGGRLVDHEIRADSLNPLGGLERVLWHQDDPFVPFNLYVHLAIYQAAREQGVRVLLDGIDGDTTVSHGLERLPDLAKHLQFTTLYREARAVAERSPKLTLHVGAVLWTHALTPLLPGFLRTLLQGQQGQPASPLCRNSVISRSFTERLDHQARIDRHGKAGLPPFRSARLAHARNLESPLLPHVLEQADKASAAYSLEARYPFCDRRLMEFCLALPADQKLRGGWTRSILRRAMQGILPPEVQWRNSKADLSPNFRAGVSTFGRETLDRALEALGANSIDRFLDLSALKALSDRAQGQPSDTNTMTLFMATTFLEWMRLNDFVQHS